MGYIASPFYNFVQRTEHRRRPGGISHERTKWTSPLQLPIFLTHEGLVHFGAKRMSRSDNFPYAFLRILAECFCFIGNPKEFPMEIKNRQPNKYTFIRLPVANRVWRDSNPRHTVPETVALSPELQTHFKFP